MQLTHRGGLASIESCVSWMSPTYTAAAKNTSLVICVGVRTGGPDGDRIHPSEMHRSRHYDGMVQMIHPLSS
jgi:hypothetical protein